MKSTREEEQLDWVSQLSSGKTSRESSAQKTTHSGAFWESSQDRGVNCSRQGKNGETLVVCLDHKEQSRGGSLMPNISEWPNDAAVCLLSQVLETGSIPQKYFLSPKACAGILRRAEKRGKKLPVILQQALEATAKGVELSEQQGEIMGGGSETLAVHGTQDPCVSDKAFALGRNSRQENAVFCFDALSSNSMKSSNPNSGCNQVEIARCLDTTVPCPSKNQGGNAVLSVALRGRKGGATAELGGPVAGTLRASIGGGDKPHVLSVGGTIAHTLRGEGFDASEDGTGRGTPVVSAGMAVRRLTPVECERLQGFPDNHTLVPYRNKPACDGPRYKAIGNSKAVPCIQWIGKRIDAYLRGEIQ